VTTRGPALVFLIGPCSLERFFTGRSTTMQTMARLAGVGCVLVALGMGLPAQERKTGTVAGTVVDRDNSPLRGVQVRLKDQQAGESIGTETDKDGRFQFASVPVGDSYLVGASLDGYRTVEERRIKVTENRTTSVSIEMQSAREAPDSITAVVSKIDGSKVYIDVGTQDGVKPGMKFLVYRAKKITEHTEPVGTLEVLESPAASSALCRVTSHGQRDRPEVGDTAVYTRK
jgi:hypothetical protein